MGPQFVDGLYWVCTEGVNVIGVQLDVPGLGEPGAPTWTS